MWFPLFFYSLNAAKSDFISRSALFLRQFALKSPVYQGPSAQSPENGKLSLS
jgi:hypothetical protein